MEPHVDRNSISNSNTAFTQLADSFKDSPHQARHVRARDKLIYIHDKVGNSKWAAIKDFFSSRSARRREGLAAVKKALIDQYGNDVAEKALAKQGLQNARGIKVHALATLDKHAADIQKQSTDYDLHSKTLGADEAELQSFREAGFSAEQANSIIKQFEGGPNTANGGLRKIIRDTYHYITDDRNLKNRNPDDVRELLYQKSYSNANSKKLLDKANHRAYFEALGAIKDKRPPNAQVVFQRGNRSYRGFSFTDAQMHLKNNIANELDRGFYHFLRASSGNGSSAEKPRERVYLNVAADHATDVMADIVSEVVDQPGNFPGILNAKVAGAGPIGERRDAIVIYVDSEANRNKVLEYLRAKYANTPHYFESESPPMTQPVAPGISSGQEPIESGKWSFGTIRCQAIAEAMRDTANQERAPEDQLSAYLENLATAFRKYQISLTNVADNSE